VLFFAISEIFKIKKRPPSNLRKGTWHRALGTIFIIIALFSVADKLFIFGFRPFLFFEKFRKNPNKKAAFGAGTPKAAGRNIQFSANAIIPTFACSKLKESLHLHFSAKSMGTQTFMGLFYFFGIGGTNPAPFDLLKSPSGIPQPIMYKKCRAERSTLHEDNKKAPRPYGPGAPLYIA
jgi:hypothetical protein